MKLVYQQSRYTVIGQSGPPLALSPDYAAVMNFRHLTLYITPLFAIAATCDLLASDSVAGDKAAADIGLVHEAGRPVRAITTPQGYQQGDRLITYEGPGWESDRVAFRLYLDGRNALDVFGKRSPQLVLSQTGRGADYHKMSEWGMDILKVGVSLGAGGIGVLDAGRVRQIGEARRYKAEIIDDTAASAGVRVTHVDSTSCGGDMTIEYSIDAGQRMTDVRVLSHCALPLAAALVIHPDTVRLASSGSGNNWQYIARYGTQSLAGDGLGLALFYRGSQVAETGQDADDDYIVFRPDQMPEYKTAAAWTQEPDGLTDIHAFRGWLRRTQSMLNQNSK